jgi:DNA sulfur modification protein DndC
MAFDRKELEEEIRDQYLINDGNKSWIIGYSGGKDSTMMLQLVWYALMKVPKTKRKRDIHVVCNNTLVENPQVLEFVENSLVQIEKGAKKQSYPVTVNQTTPTIEDSFWINLIGKGYPAPNNMFRWCTDRLKIKPTTKFILDKINDVGEVIILLGTRESESAARGARMKKHEIKGSRLRKHSSLPFASVYAPIKKVTTDEVWQYLMAAPSPWGAKNKALVTLYGNASAGDCPLITDISTPSCGQSRFGCWVCTVVNKDKSMEHLIDNGEEWLEPLVDLRDFLHSTINRESKEFDDFEKVKEKYRMNRRRNGAEGYGPYKPEWRAHILTELLKAQKSIDAKKENFKLITNQELVAIQVTWHRDDIFDYNVSDIYKSIYKKEFGFKAIANEGLIKEKELLKESCGKNEGDYNLINQLLTLQKSKTILVKKYGLQNDLENQLDEFIKKPAHVH